MLIVLSIFDWRDRIVRNEILLVAGLCVIPVLLITGRLLVQIELRLISVITITLMSYLLFRLKSLGGADAKTFIVVGLLSPGIEFAIWGNVLLEAVLPSLLLVLISLVLGYIWWKFIDSEQTPPLIIFILISYVIIQVLAFLSL